MKNKILIFIVLLFIHEVGGDYYDFIEFEDGSLLAICGDATCN